MNKKRMSVRETLKLNNRALSIFYRRYPQMVLSRFISVIWTALTPYVGIFLSALVIDELAGERNPQRLRVLVLTTLFFTALAALASALLNKSSNLASGAEKQTRLSLPEMPTDLSQ